MMEKKNILNIKNILRDFSGLAEARRNPYIPYETGVHIQRGDNRDGPAVRLQGGERRDEQDTGCQRRGREFVHFKAVRQDMLYESLLKNHCYHTAYYLNSFDRLSLQENRARALFLVNKPDTNTIFAKYQADRGGTATPWNSEWSTGRSSRRCSRYPSAGTSITSPSVSPEHHQRK